MTAQTGRRKPFEFRFEAAPADLAQFLNSFYFFESEQALLEDVLPAYSGQLILPLGGSFTLIRADGTSVTANEPVLLAPLLHAHAFRVEGPAKAFGVSLNFRGWAAITGLSVAKHNNTAFPPDLALGEEAATRLRRLVSEVLSGECAESDMPEATAEIVRECVQDLSPSHRKVIDSTLDWLSESFRPELADLYSALPYSRRQVQRLVKQYFGVSPVYLARRYRAVRAATVLSMPNITPQLEAEMSSAFYDQPHMIKEIRYFTGRTPKRLLKADDTVVTDTLDPKGYSAVRPFGAGEDEQLGKAGGS